MDKNVDLVDFAGHSSGYGPCPDRIWSDSTFERTGPLWPLKYPWDNSLFPNITVILACVKQFGFFGLIGSFDLDLTAILWRETEKITAGLIWNRFKTKLYFCLMSALAHQTRSKVCVVTVYG